MNNIGESGARMISESLKTNTTLTELGLSGDEKRSKNEMNNNNEENERMKEWNEEYINDNENTKERDRNDKWWW